MVIRGIPVKNATPQPLRLAVPFGQLEARERMSAAEHEELLALNRSRYCIGADSKEMPTMRSRLAASKAGAGFELGEHEIL